MADLACCASNNSASWGFVDLVRWKLVPERFGGGRAYIQRFKDAWVRHNRAQINNLAQSHAIPPELLAGTAWIEVGGDPTFVDTFAFEVRSFDWSGPSWIDRHMTVTRDPMKTSFGPVSMQLRTAAQTMGLDPDALSEEQARRLASCLQKDVFNLTLVAKHLHDLALHDFPNADTRRLTPDQVRVVGARYNRGTGPSLESIRQNTSYGDFIVNHWTRFQLLLIAAPAAVP